MRSSSEHMHQLTVASYACICGRLQIVGEVILKYGIISRGYGGHARENVSVGECISADGTMTHPTILSLSCPLHVTSLVPRPSTCTCLPSDGACVEGGSGNETNM